MRDMKLGKGVQKGRFELGDVKNRVDPLELLWKADCDGVCPQGTYYLERSQVLLCQFSQRLGGLEKLHFDIHLLANLEGWWRHLLMVHCFLIVFMGLCN